MSIAEAINRFAFDLYRALGADGGEDAVCAPASLHLALSMVELGARGTTRAQLAQVLHAEALAESLPDAHRAQIAAWRSEGERLAVANRLVAERSLAIEAAFIARLETAYGASFEAADFAADPDGARQRINAWVSDRTRQRIRALLPPESIGPATLLVLASALYFKADWALKFCEELTQPGPFTLASGQQVQVPTMHMTEQRKVLLAPELSILELDYQLGRFAMDVLLPPASSSLAALEAELDADRLDRWLARLEPRYINVDLPRFTIDAPAVALRQPLAELGMSEAFDLSRADFGGMTDRPLALDDVVHKTYLAVTEDGTEAAAASAAFAEQELAPPDTPSFSATRPFAFVLRDLRDGAIVFLGRVTDPRPSDV